MNGVHDLGGVQGFGPVRPEPESEEPVFHEEWEGRVYAMVRLIGGLGLWNLDMVRHTRENLRPADYLAYSYYEIWFAALQKQLVESGLVSGGGVADGQGVIGRLRAHPGAGDARRAGASHAVHDHELSPSRAGAGPVRAGRPRAGP